MSLRIALFGQAPLAVDVLDGLVEAGHEVVAVYAPPDSGRPDALAERAEALGLRLFRRRYFRRKDGGPIRAALDDYEGLGAELNVLASMTSFLPREITDAPVHKSVCYHPSLLPRFRGGNALQWQIIEGERETGVTVFVPDEGADTGPVVVQKGGATIDADDTTGSLFFKKLYPLGVEAVLEAVAQVDAGADVPKAQDESRASHQGLVDDAVAAIDLTSPAEVIDRRVRGCDPQPGAWLRFRGEPLRLYDAVLEPASAGSKPGAVLEVSDGGLRIALRGGVLRVGRVRGDAGKEKATEFARRCGLAVGEDLGSA
ncbi:MAG: methionyl-tRNA formyltransferase [Deltaproteobacteria bacterium]|nr:methionyl-tRNA formyltransferase [Deltaproteobacteria bacterium]MBW2414175.1 methionyl-tRNA formyltransferase [Deltaproteobacteria bacterium]